MVRRFVQIYASNVDSRPNMKFPENMVLDLAFYDYYTLWLDEIKGEKQAVI